MKQLRHRRVWRAVLALALIGAAGPSAVAITAAPRVTDVVLNPAPNRTLRGVSEIEPSGLGVETVQVAFDKDVTFASSDVTAQKVTFNGQLETVVETLSGFSVAGSGSDGMSILFPYSWETTVDTWVKITLLGNGTLQDTDGQALDGEARLDSSNLGYIRDAVKDLPSGDGTPGGDAIFYVGSLRADMRGFGPMDPEPNGAVDSWDISGFTSQYLTGNLDADFRGFGPMQLWPDGVVDSWDISGFTSYYLAATAGGTHLSPLPQGPHAPEPATVVGLLLGVGCVTRYIRRRR